MSDGSETKSPVSPNAHLGVPSENWTTFYAKHSDVVPKLVGTPEYLRKIMVELKNRAQSLVPLIKEGLDVYDTPMPTSDGSSIQLRIYTPKNGSIHSNTALVYIHGGGWTLGDLDGEDGICRTMCVKGDVVVISVDWRLAPEFPFPTSLNDSWEALNWTIRNATKLHIDPKRVIIAGSSSGGNTILRIPATCHIESYPPELHLLSLEELKDAPLLSKRSMELFWGYYNAPDPSHPDVSPLLAKSFKGLAPTYIQIAGLDPLRDEGLAYAEKLRDAGISVNVSIYSGLPHAFGYFPELPDASQNALDLIKAIRAMSHDEILL